MRESGHFTVLSLNLRGRIKQNFCSSRMNLGRECNLIFILAFFLLLLSLDSCFSIQRRPPSSSSSSSSRRMPSHVFWSRRVPSSTSTLTLLESSVEFGQQTRKEKITLDDIIYGIFAPRTFNGSWITDDELLYRDSFGNLVVMNVSAPPYQEPKILVSNYTFVSIST